MRTAAVVAGILWALSLSGAASAGQPKGLRVSEVTIDHGEVVVGIVGTSAEFTTNLAQVVAPKTHRSGRPCARHPTDSSIATLASSMGLANDAQVTLDRRLRSGDDAYLARSSRQFAVARTLNAAAVRQGLARVSRQKGRYRTSLLRIQRVAAKAHRGMWSRCKQ